MFFVDKLMSVIFLFLVYFDNVETVMSLLAMIISSKSTLPSYSILAADTFTWPTDFGHWSYITGHMVNTATKFEDTMFVHSELYEITYSIHYHRQCI